jgi:hypothetical protein
LNIQEYIKNLQNLPEKVKKAILIAVVLVVSLILGYFWIDSAMRTLSQAGQLGDSMNLPNIDLPDLQTPTDQQAQNTPAAVLDTTDWKTYANTEYGFEMKYPDNVIVKQDGDIVMVHDERPELPFDWSMKFYQNDKKLALTDWINSQFDSFAQTPDKDCKIVAADTYGSKINIENAYTVLIDAPSYEASCGHVGYYTISPDKLTIMEFPDVQSSPELYQDIISTFKFINPKS